MKTFWVKCIGVAIAAFVLFTYQTQTHTLNVVRAALADKAETVEQSQGGAENGGTAAGYKDGTYKGTGIGYAGDLTVEVTVEGGKITNIEIIETSDDKEYLSKAEALTDDIIAKQQAEGIDTVTGATYSSKGILEATEKALEESTK